MKSDERQFAFNTVTITQPFKGQRFRFTLAVMLEHIATMCKTGRIMGDAQEAVLQTAEWLATPAGEASLRAKFEAAVADWKIQREMDEQLIQEAKRLPIPSEDALRAELTRLEVAVALKRLPPVTSAGPAPKVGPHAEVLAGTVSPPTPEPIEGKQPVYQVERTHYGRQA